MSLSTLLEAAKYLDYLDSSSTPNNSVDPGLANTITTQQPNQNANQQQHQQQQHQQQQFFYQQSQPKPTTRKSTSSGATASSNNSARRQRFSKKNAANTMLAMSLPANTGTIQMHSVPIPLTTPSGDSHHHHNNHYQGGGASLSSSFTTGSPSFGSSFASTALFCSSSSSNNNHPHLHQASAGVASNSSSSAASSLSSSDSSSSCGEILMNDVDFNQSLGKQSTPSNHLHHHQQQQHQPFLANHHHNYHLNSSATAQQQQFETTTTTNHQQAHFIQGTNNNNSATSNQPTVARYIAATSNGPQLVTMTTTSGSTALASASAPVDGNIRAGHIIHAAQAGAALISASPGTSYDPRQHTSFSLATSPPGMSHLQHHHHTYNNSLASGSSDNHLNNTSSSSTNNTSNPNCPPLFMARVQPMILNSISPSAQHSIMAFQPTIASSPTSSTSSYSRHRELHKTLEKNRRAHLRHCFELLKCELPPSECVDKKTSHINIIRSAIRYVLILRQQEVEFENELHRLTKIKNELTEKLSKLNLNSPEEEAAETISTLSSASQQQHQNQTQTTPISIPSAATTSIKTSSSPTPSSSQQGDIIIKTEQQPVPEQQLSFLLSQSKLD